MKFKMANVNCINCANTIKNSLEAEFGKIEIDLNTKILSVELEEDKLERFDKELKELGFEIVERIS